ncbi:hypothetical protein [Nocardioides sambongensis]|uniref:hypothetical protein n=1 Tax=Nocardioides sambongensis TaxID=2589074 RepID=UPI001127E759|nr:hypothetical protein [Nocardioides sambongensis]
MADNDLGPRPEPAIEPGEPEPGGTDALEFDTGDDAGSPDPDLVPHDPDPEKNPSTESVPEEMKEGEDTSTRATEEQDEEPADTSEDDDPA